ncbi:glycosyltransferase family 2 protein [Gramella sp. MT6]|uniref:glycosyltransferase family 2 protein n=1 Tax=Gramella sp. MT6 TaxID=2705471 RepID=UPI001C5EA873|nr:glycosyltransferase [Gramella sp. MT6]QYA26047.1 glycosyltransferase family 2 protein [Gramella sp. MT6]
MDFNTFRKLFEVEPVIEKKNSTPKKPMVSVCIQTYNQENYISQCIESILSQETTFQFEILLADDGSDDETPKICLYYANKYPNKIRYIIHSRINNIKVLGQSSANFISIFNFFSARGKYIAICEGDDFWGDSQKLQKQYEFMEENPGYSLCYHSFIPVNDKGIYIDTQLVSPIKKSIKSKDLIFPWVHPSTLTIFFRNILDKIPIEATKVLTLDVFLYSILGNFGPGKYLKEISPSYYRLQDNGLWGKRDLSYKLLNKINTYKNIGDYYKRIDSLEFSKVFRSRILKLRLYLFYYNLKKFRFKKAFQNLL